MKGLTETAQQTSFADIVGKILPLLPQILVDSEDVIRQALAEELAPLASLLVTKGNVSSIPSMNSHMFSESCVCNQLTPSLVCVLLAVFR